MTTFALRVVGVTIAGFLLSALCSFWLLNIAMHTYMLRRLDDGLKTEGLDVAAVLDLLGPEPDPEKMAGELERLGHTRGVATHYFRIFTAKGEVLAQSDPHAWSDLSSFTAEPLQVLAQEVGREVFVFKTYKAQTRTHSSRCLALAVSEQHLLQVCVDLGETQELLGHARMLYGAAICGVLALGSLLGWWATRKPLAGIAAVGHAASGVTHALKFDVRVPCPTGSLETDRLAHAFNTMIDKIQSLLQGQREMSDSIAHDIRSPVARMRAAAEAAMNDGRDPDLAAGIIEDCERILNLVSGLLELSAAEVGAYNWVLTPINLSDLVREAAELFEPLLEQKHQNLNLDLAADTSVAGDLGVLQRVVGNLLDNAIKYTGEFGTIQLQVCQTAAQVKLRVTDNGPGMTAEECARIFERFYRVDASRGEPGNGLGLSFCKAAVEALGGTIEVTSKQGSGSSFTVSLPRPT